MTTVSADGPPLLENTATSQQTSSATKDHDSAYASVPPWEKRYLAFTWRVIRDRSSNCGYSRCCRSFERLRDKTRSVSAGRQPVCLSRLLQHFHPAMSDR